MPSARSCGSLSADEVSASTRGPWLWLRPDWACRLREDGENAQAKRAEGIGLQAKFRNPNFMHRAAAAAHCHLWAKHFTLPLRQVQTKKLPRIARI